MYPKFDRTKIILRPLAERVSDLNVSIVNELDNKPADFTHPAINPIASAMAEAKQRNSTVLMMYGGHVIRTGNAGYMIRLMKAGLVTHFATNGAGSIHDFELALTGGTSESVAKYISEGQFGLWKETGMINDIVREGLKDGLGWGEALGRYIWENNLPYRETSVLAQGYHNRVPCTVHAGIGSDIINEHPNCDGAALGEASYTDFLVYTQSITKLEGGVFLNFGSAVAGPEVYLKALAMARNVAHQEGRRITDFSTAVFDLQPLEGDTSKEPSKSNPHYYFRPWKTILARTVADGGRSYYISGSHDKTLPALVSRVIELDKANN